MKTRLRLASVVNISAIACMLLGSTSTAAVFTFNEDPFLGSDALTTPGRQIVGGEPFITFSPATDSFVFATDAFGISSISFFNGIAADVPASNVNMIVLQTFGDPFGAGTAANLLANQITSSQPGFFVYFNSGLDLARLVYSTDLSDSSSDLKILARMTNLSGADGRAELATFTADNFPEANAVPDASSFLTLLLCAVALTVARIATSRPPSAITPPRT